VHYQAEILVTTIFEGDKNNGNKKKFRPLGGGVLDEKLLVIHKTVLFSGPSQISNIGQFLFVFILKAVLCIKSSVQIILSITVSV
jgi:hypothetical protein